MDTLYLALKVLGAWLTAGIVVGLAFGVFLKGVRSRYRRDE